MHAGSGGYSNAHYHQSAGNPGSGYAGCYVGFRASSGHSGHSGHGGSGDGYGSSGGGAGSGRAAKGEAVTPERPRHRRGSKRSPVYYRRSSSRPGGSSITNNVAPSSGSPTPGGVRGGPGRGASARAQGSAGGISGGVGAGLSLRGHEEGGVRVAVRVRPLSVEEEARGGERTIRCCNPKTLEMLNTPVVPNSSGRGGVGGSGGDGGGGSGGSGGSGGGGEEVRKFNFDLCAHEGFNQAEMFESCGLKPLLSAAVDGYAGTVFAYGATGAGKTYTMSGREQIMRENSYGNGGSGRLRGYSARGDPHGDTEGLVPRSMRYIFERIGALPDGVRMRVRASCYEIYNEFVYDLLAQGERPLQVRYDVKHGFFVQGLFEVEIRGLNDIMAVVDEGNSNRRVSSHLLNKESSRSHSLLSLYLQSEWKDPEDGHLVKRFGKVAFVDLAGSERLKKSRAVDGKETASINKSLMTLGKVISALSRRSAAAAATSTGSSATASTGPSGGFHSVLPDDDDININSSRNNSSGGVDPSDIWVPYRDSTLTKLLMDSLGGNGLTLMVACVSPAARHTEESVATLNYAARARNIRNRPLVRIDARERLINALRRETNLLRQENALLRQGKIVPPMSIAPNGNDSRNHAVGGEDTDRGGRGEASEGTGMDVRDDRRDSNSWLEQMTQGVWSQSGDQSEGAVAGSVGGEAVSGVVTAGEAGMEQGRLPVSVPLEDGAEAAFQIGQASRDVALLLRKYEDECHRLRNEAALAQQKEQEIGKQTRQALMENDALSKTVERLQREFGKQPDAGNEGLVGKRETAALEQQKVTTTQTITGDVGSEVLHLRRVNEALVERVEYMERNQLGLLSGRTRVSTESKSLEPEPKELKQEEKANEEAPADERMEDKSPETPPASSGDANNDDDSAIMKREISEENMATGIGDDDDSDDDDLPKYSGIIRDFEDVREVEVRQKQKIMAAGRMNKLLLG